MVCLRLVLPFFFIVAATLILWRPIIALAGSPANDRAQKFIDAHVANLRPLEVKSNLVRQGHHLLQQRRVDLLLQISKVEDLNLAGHDRIRNADTLV